MRLAVEGERDGKRVAGQIPIRAGKSDQPRTIGILEKNDAGAIRKFRGGDTKGKSAFVGGVGRALPLADMDDPKWASSEACVLNATQANTTSNTRDTIAIATSPHAKLRQECYHRLCSRKGERARRTKLNGYELGSYRNEQSSFHSI